MSLKEELQKVIAGEVDDSPAALEVASRDAGLYIMRPEVVVRPKDAEDVCKVVQLVNEKVQVPKTHISIVARSAGTDMSGGPLGDSIILDMTAHFNKLVEVTKNPKVSEEDSEKPEDREGFAIVEPGVYYRDFDVETEKKDLQLPSYTASRELNTVGGMVANNSGGEKNLNYGKTTRYVEELEVVLSDGRVHTLKNLTGEELQKKLGEEGFEGDLYRQVAKLITTHRQVIEDRKPKVEKNSSGYALWDIGNGTDSLNLARLRVGAQGTLGIITRI